MNPERAAAIKAKAHAAHERLAYDRARQTLERLLAEHDQAQCVDTYLARSRGRAIWDAYVGGLRREAGSSRRWPEADPSLVRATLAEALGTGARRCCWLLPEPCPVAATIRVDAIDIDGSLRFASRQRDLMLASEDGSSGLCLELNAVGRSNKYELVTWGGFAAGE